MQSNKIIELGKKYDLELDKIISEVNAGKARRVLLQFPDGLKQYAVDVVNYLEEATKQWNKQNESKIHQHRVEFVVWGGSCFGACDIPQFSAGNEKEFDLIIQFGHAPWK